MVSNLDIIITRAPGIKKLSKYIGMRLAELLSLHPGQGVPTAITNSRLFGLTPNRGVMHPTSLTFFARCRHHPNKQIFYFLTLKRTLKSLILY
jgi:hypothetical protein